MSNNTYKSIPEIIHELKALSDKLEAGNMPASELDAMLNDVRELYERMIVLRHKALESEVKSEEPVATTEPIPEPQPEAQPEPQPEPEPEEKEEPPVVEESKPSFGGFKFNIGSSSEKETQKAEVEEPKAEEEPKPEEVEVKETAFEIPLVENVESEKQPSSDIHPNQTNLLDAIEEQQKEESLNEKLAPGEVKTLADQLQMSRIEDLKKAIGINMKYLFMNDLFEGENSYFNEAIDQLNSFGTLDEARTYMDSLQKKYSWDREHKSVIKFIELVERRYQ